MKISSSNIETAVDNRISGAPEADGAGSARSAAKAQPTASPDSVKLSNATRLVAIAKAITPPAQQAKLAQIKASVKSGEYQADTAEVSRSVVEGHLRA